MAMIMTTRLVLLLLLPLLGSCLSSVGGRVHVAYLHMEPTGDLGLEDSGASQPLGQIKIDLENEFDLNDAGTPYVRVDLHSSDWNLEVSGFSFDQSSDSTLTARFGDIPQGTDVRTDLSAINAKAALTYTLVDVSILDIGVGICLNYFDIDMDVRSQSILPAPATSYEQTDFRAPVPMLFARAGLDAGPVGADLSVGWLSADLQDAKGTFWDIDAMIRLEPIPNVDVFGGYRYISIDAQGVVDAQRFDTDLHLRGWYVGVGLTF